MVRVRANSSSDIGHVNSRSQNSNPELRAAPNRPLSSSKVPSPKTLVISTWEKMVSLAARNGSFQRDMENYSGIGFGVGFDQ